MKFDSFIKYAGSHGAILEAKNGDKWLFFGDVGMKIPEGKNVCGIVGKMPEEINILITTSDYNACELEKAFVPNKDSKPSELLRKFGNDDYEIDIPNKIFGFIERKDRTYISIHDDIDYDYTALLVTDDYSEEPDFKMIYIVKE